MRLWDPATGETIRTLTGHPGGVTAAAFSPDGTRLATASDDRTVIMWDEDHEPTGLRYDITLLHDNGSTTDVEVDTVTGQVTSVDHDNDGD